jgi:hypothetical protein
MKSKAMPFNRSSVGLSLLLLACVSESPGNGGASNFVKCTSDEECPSGRCSARNLCVEDAEASEPDRRSRASAPTLPTRSSSI